MDKNSEIDELQSKINILKQTEIKLRKENWDLNQEALDLENKICIMDKMCKTLQENEEEGNNRLNIFLVRKDSRIKELESELLGLRSEFYEYKKSSEKENKNSTLKDVSTEPMYSANIERESHNILHWSKICNNGKLNKLVHSNENKSERISEENPWEFEENKIRKRNGYF